MKRLLLFLALFGVHGERHSAGAAPPPRWNSDESKVAPYTLPDALLSEDGTRVKDAKTWTTIRRDEILRSFSALMYGRTPELPLKIVCALVLPLDNEVISHSLRPFTVADKGKPVTTLFA